MVRQSYVNIIFITQNTNDLSGVEKIIIWETEILGLLELAWQS